MTRPYGRGSVQIVSTQPTNDAAAGTVLSEGWWSRGLALHERLDGAPGTGRAVEEADLQHARNRLDRWRAASGLGAVDAFAQQLTSLGMAEEELLTLLVEQPADLSARVARPLWVDVVEAAVRAAAGPAVDSTAPADWLAAFARPLRPFVTQARERFAGQAAHHLPPHHADLAAIGDQFAMWLGQRLARLAARTLVLELNERRERGQLAGADSRQRFADFIRQVSEPAGLAALFERYPVLARLLGDAAGSAADSELELLLRYAGDRPAIVTRLLDGIDPGPLTAVETHVGDPHQHGRAVAVLTFADGRQVVYKPRSLAAYDHLAQLARWLTEAVPGLRLRTAATVSRDGYGWLEFVNAQPLADAAEADVFYRRQGALLALLHAVRASDVHCANLIAAGDQPVLIDMETLFHPNLRAADQLEDPAREALTESVYRTCLLPFSIVGENGNLDVSGLGGDQAQLWPTNMVDWAEPLTDRMRLRRRPAVFQAGFNRPRLGRRTMEPRDHKAALLEGFRLGYDAILHRRDDFAAVVAAGPDADVRIVARPTRLYAVLLEESTHPDVLRDGLDRDEMFNCLWAASARDPIRQRLVRHEVADLWSGDVPLFIGRPSASHGWSSDGTRLPELWGSTGLSRTLAGLAQFSLAARQDQEWIISATLATGQALAPHTSAGDLAGPHSTAVAGSDQLLAAACGLADQIVARGVTSQDRVNWLGVERVDNARWMVLPMGAGLAYGYTGVALFLAQLADLTGVARYRDLALRTLMPVPRMCQALARRADLVRAVGCGGLYGFGGIAYALARVAGLTGDPRVRRCVEMAVELAGFAANIEPGAAFGVTDGSAGCLAAMTAVHAELGLDSAVRVAATCAARLSDLVVRTEGRCVPEDKKAPIGFHDGSTGVGWALARFAALPAGESVAEAAGLPVAAAEAASLALDHSAQLTTMENHEMADVGWCSGLAGITAARLSVGAPVPDGPDAVGAPDRALRRDLSLCHGELGVIEALTVRVTQEPSPAVAHLHRRRAGLVLDAIGRHGPYCGVPGGVPTPGLLTGLAGIGYGLLRLGFPDKVPSLLLLEPAPVSVRSR